MEVCTCPDGDEPSTSDSQGQKIQNVDTNKQDPGSNTPTVSAYSPEINTQENETPEEQPKEKPFKEIPPKSDNLLGSFFNVNEPTPKMKEIRNDGKMGISFNNKMLLPDDFLETVNANKRRRLEGKNETAIISIISEPG